MGGKKMSEINPNNPPRSYLKRTCRYQIRSPSDIHGRMTRLIQKYSSISGYPLPETTISVIKKQYNKHIKNGCVVDPYTIDNMYITRSDQLYHYHTKRGTSIMENYHRGIRSILSGTSAGTHLVDTLLREYNFRHNQRAAWRNLGTKKSIHYDLRLLHQLNELHQKLFPSEGKLYQVFISETNTQEKFGVRGSAAAMVALLGVGNVSETLDSTDCVDETVRELEEEDEVEEQEDLCLSDVSSLESFDCYSSSDPDDASEPLSPRMLPLLYIRHIIRYNGLLIFKGIQSRKVLPWSCDSN